MKLTPPDINHPAVAVAPKTLREALERIVENARKSKNLVRQYKSATGAMCAIGHFFTDEQLTEIKDKKANGFNIARIVEVFGSNNIEFMTGLTKHQAEAVQQLNDFLGPRKVCIEIGRILNEGVGNIYGVSFDLQDHS